MDALCHRPENFLVPHGWDSIKIAVNDTDRKWILDSHSIDIALGNWGQIDGIQYLLDAFDDDGTLILVFGDLTNGLESYSAGRFLLVSPDPGSDEITLNFNHAFVPPCGFSIHYNCPLPPPQNRIQKAIRAGERNSLFGQGYDAH